MNNGIKRKLDGLGRICIPSEIRKDLKMGFEDFIIIQVENNKIILEKVSDVKCCFCNSESDLKEFKSLFICNKCLKELNN